jgi:hypothetical protein
MSLLDLFRRKKKQSANSTPVVDNSVTDQNGRNASTTTTPVDYSLFVEDQAPSLAEVPKQTSNSIERFVNQNFQAEGYNNGYEFPEAEYLENKVKLIKSDFRLVIDMSIDNKKSELYQLKLHLIQVSGISQRLEAQLNEKIKFVEADIQELEKQKNLSIDCEGIISSSIHAYRLGFIRGIEKYQQEKLFAGATGLFN